MTFESSPAQIKFAVKYQPATQRGVQNNRCMNARDVAASFALPRFIFGQLDR